MSKIQIGITGGIGSGKSMVSHILRAMQYPVYDTDSEAKRIMDTAPLRAQLAEAWGDAIFHADGTLNRAQLAAVVFGDAHQLKLLNGIVHPAVRQDYAEWVEKQTSPIVFVESAILHQAKMDAPLQHIWVVEADHETRIERVMQRSGLSRTEIEARMASQKAVPTDHRTHIIDNNASSAIVPQILKLINIANEK